MSYVRKSLVPGETLMYDTRHHWIVLIGPLILVLFVGGGLDVACLGEVAAARSGQRIVGRCACERNACV